MFILLSLSVAVSIFISRSAASISHDVISGTVHYVIIISVPICVVFILGGLFFIIFRFHLDVQFDDAHSTKVSPLSFLCSSPHLPFAVSPGFVLFPFCTLKSPAWPLFSLDWHSRWLLCRVVDHSSRLLNSPVSLDVAICSLVPSSGGSF